MFATWEWEANKMGEQNMPLTKDSFSKLYYDILTEFRFRISIAAITFTPTPRVTPPPLRWLLIS